MSPKQGKQKSQKQTDSGNAQAHLTQSGEIVSPPTAPRQQAQAPAKAQEHYVPGHEDYSQYSTEKLISLAFDEKPKIRMRVAQELAKRPEDSTAVFGLIELCTDKDEAVKETAKRELAKMEGDQNADTLEQLFLEKKVEDPDMNKVKAKLMPSIEKLFTKKDGKSHMETSIKKLFAGSASGQQPGAQGGALSGLPVVGEAARPAEQAGEKAEEEAGEDTGEPEKMFQSGDSALDQAIAEHEQEAQPEVHQGEAGMLEEIQAPDAKPDEEHAEAARHQIDIYSKAAAIAKRPGTTEKDLKNEEKRLMQKLKEEVKEAFTQAREMLAVNRDKAVRDLKPGMQKVNTAEMEIRACEKVEITKGKKKSYVYRMEISDKTGTGIMYVPEGKGKGLEPGDHVRATGCNYEKNALTGEDCLTLGPRSKLIIVR